ncbi:indole-3-glycerol phosphate synthase TrpC [Euhalothece natronophila Z-M001]|uniref:Indole-3-glycerol phosphate synthase n=1 Tax=Euhalothece natronophila Z-M001 TaxID=522448 RepID=A0A5B8NLW8_9CHRO|nr:indole-3-glycerol phosphate synthase TrpC [Euhalothece natronophila]QDZ39531.1 indole-3-glycerol phosphate synthase TrpC [Euhalothece natronophila Z-M001]
MRIRRRPQNPEVNVNTVSYQVALPNDKPDNILEEIVWQKEKEVDRSREKIPFLQLRKQVQDNAPPVKNFLKALQKGERNPALIAEIKKASPSKGVIREDFDPITLAKTYEEAGASCLSVLTDATFFQGSFENLGLVREATNLPLLCKEFIIYAYQIYQARLMGADAILLIAAILNDQDLNYFVKIVNSVGMTPLVEVHTLEELDRALSLDGVKLIGINNRNLENFTVDIQTTVELIQQRQEQLKAKNITLVSESGLHTLEDLEIVKNAGANAVLIGESLLVKPDPKSAIAALYNS